MKHPGPGWREKFSCSLSCLGTITDVLIRFITTSGCFFFFFNVLLIFFSFSPLCSILFLLDSVHFRGALL